MPAKKRNRPDKDGAFKSAYQKNKARILAETDICALCGLPIDKNLRFPDPYSATVDHIIPIAKGGHPSDIENLQATHLICNQLKGTKTVVERNRNLIIESETVSNRELPQSLDWKNYRG